MRIKDIEIKGHVVLAPMAGVTTLAYREFMKPFGVGLSYSEMISDCGICYGNEKTFDYLATSEIDSPVGLQLFGFSKEYALKAISIIEKQAHYDILDLNMGCPVNKVVKTGAGSSWMKRTDELFDYVSSIVQVSSKPVTAKIRLGFDEEHINFREVALLLQKAGISALGIHCRTRSQFYSGKARYEDIRGLKEELNISLIVSGDIFSDLDAKRAIDITGADAVMVARGGLGNPFLVTQINHYLETGERLPNPTLEQQLDYAKTFSRMLIKQKGEKTAISELRGLLPHFFKGFPGYKKIRLFLSTTIKSQEDLENFWFGLEQK